MLKDMPVGHPVHTDKPDISKDFGFFYVEVEAPNMHIPLLPTKNEQGILITPCGSWRGWYFSEELRDAIGYGYVIKPI